MRCKIRNRITSIIAVGAHHRKIEIKIVLNYQLPATCCRQSATPAPQVVKGRAG